MIREFEIIKVFKHHNWGTIIFARHLGTNHDFVVPDGAFLGDLKVFHYKDMPPIQDENDNLRPEIFVFRPFDMKDLFDTRFKEDDRVILTIE